MRSILFTKAIENQRLTSVLGEDMEIESFDFIRIRYVDKNSIQFPSSDNIDYSLVSSRRAAKFLTKFPIHTPFYVVGDKSKALLEKHGNEVKYCTDTAQALLGHIRDELKTPKSFAFFCSNIRRDTLPEGLRALGHSVEEVICYETLNKRVALDRTYDAYVFYSPSGVKSFAQQYDIPKKASIFAIGKTTSDAIATELKRKAYFPNRADMASLLQLIKTRLDAEK